MPCVSPGTCTPAARCPHWQYVRGDATRVRRTAWGAASAAQSGPLQLEQRPLTTPAAVLDFIDQQPQLRALLGPRDGLAAEPVEDGIMNLVWAVGQRRACDPALPSAAAAGPAPSGVDAVLPPAVILKQALPHVRVDPSFPLSRARMEVEARAMAAAAGACPGRVPGLLLFDPQQSVLVQEVAQGCTKLTDIVQQGRILQDVGKQVGQLLGSLLDATSLAAVGEDAHAAAVAACANEDLARINEQVVLSEPFQPGEGAGGGAAGLDPQWVTPELDVAVASIRADPAVQAALAQLRHSYRTQRQCLIHNDCHGGNLLCSDSQLFCIDWEFATYAPIAYDVGFFIGNQLLMYAAFLPDQEAAAGAAGGGGGGGGGPGSRDAQRAWLLQCARDCWEEVAGRLGPDAAARALPDTLGFAAVAMLRHIMGRHPYAGHAAMQPRQLRAWSEGACLQLGRRWLAGRAGYGSLQAALGEAEQLLRPPMQAG